jgi:hypothetical protein
MFPKEKGLNCFEEQLCSWRKISPSPKGHDYSLRKKGLSCSLGQLKLLLPEDMIVLREKIIEVAFQGNLTSSSKT